MPIDLQLLWKSTKKLRTSRLTGKYNMKELYSHLLRLVSNQGDLTKHTRGWLVATSIVPEVHHIMTSKDFPAETSLLAADLIDKWNLLSTNLSDAERIHQSKCLTAHRREFDLDWKGIARELNLPEEHTTPYVDGHPAFGQSIKRRNPRKLKMKR